MPAPPPPEEHRFRPGQSGNPGGRPKGRTLTERLRALMDEARLGKLTLPDGKTIGDILVETAVREALKGDFRFWNAIVERVDGKVPDKVELDAQLKKVVVEYADAGDGAGDDTPDPPPPAPGTAGDPGGDGEV